MAALFGHEGTFMSCTWQRGYNGDAQSKTHLEPLGLTHTLTHHAFTDICACQIPFWGAPSGGETVGSQSITVKCGNIA